MMTPQHVPQLQYWTFRQVVWATFTLVMVTFCFWLIYRFYQVIFTLFIAIVFGTVIRPLVNWMHQKGLPRITGVLFVYLMLFILLLGFVLLLVPILIEQSATIAAAVPGYYQTFRLWMFTYPNQLVVRIGGYLPAILPGIDSIQAQSNLDMITSAGQALGFAKSALMASFTSIIVLVSAFYWALDGNRTIKSFILLIPQGQREGVIELIASMETKLGFFLAGQAVLCLSIGILSLIAYLLIGLPNAMVLALIAGMLEAVPMVGPLLGAVPAALVAISLGPDKLVWVIIATVIIQQVENSLLVPRIMSKAVGVNPFVSLLAFFAFSSLLGLPGALMAIPMTAIIQLIMDHFIFKQGSTEPDGSLGRDYASRLRYDAQNLAQDLRKQARLKKGGSDQRVKQIDYVLDEIETITTELDGLLAKSGNSGLP